MSRQVRRQLYLCSVLPRYRPIDGANAARRWVLPACVCGHIDVKGRGATDINPFVWQRMKPGTESLGIEGKGTPLRVTANCPAKRTNSSRILGAPVRESRELPLRLASGRPAGAFIDRLIWGFRGRQAGRQKQDAPPLLPLRLDEISPPAPRCRLRALWLADPSTCDGVLWWAGCSLRVRAPLCLTRPSA